MSIRTNPMKAVPSLQKRLTRIKSTEAPNIVAKLDELMSELESVKDLFSIVKRKKEEFLDTLKILDDLLRNFKDDKILLEISNRILPAGNTTKDNQGKGDDKPSSSQEAEHKKNGKKDVTIYEKLQSLKSELHNMKVEFSTEKKMEELLEKFRVVEDLLRNFNAKSFDEIKPAEDVNQSETKGSELSRQKSRQELVNQATGQEAHDKKSVEKDTPINEKLEGLKAELDNMKVMLLSTVNKNEEFRDMLRAMDDLLQNINAKSFTEIVNTTKDSNQSKAKDDDKPSSSQEAQDKKSVEKDVSIDEKLESLKSELDNMKAKFSIQNKHEELRDMLRGVEGLLQNFKAKSLVEIVQPAEDVNQSEEAKGLKLSGQASKEELVDQLVPKTLGEDNPSPYQEAQDKKSVENDVVEKLERLKYEIDNMKAKLSTVKENKELSKKPKKEEVVDQVVIAIREKFKDSAKKLGVSPSESEVNDSSSQRKTTKTLQYPKQLSLSLDNDNVDLLLKRFQASYDALSLPSKLCCLSLSIFPENVVIKKRHIIYWWIGEGFVKSTITDKMAEEVFEENTIQKMPKEAVVKETRHFVKSTITEKMAEEVFEENTIQKMPKEAVVKETIPIKKTAEEEGEDVFDDLLNSNIIVPHGNGKCPIVNKFKINPWIRHMLVSSVLGKNTQPFEIYSQITPSSHHNDAHACLVLDEKKVKLSGEGSKFNHWRSVFNLRASYLNIEHQWMAKMKKLLVLQLGRWQESPSHHIEVDSAEFLKDLKAQKNLKYLSLRGISRITGLPPSISQLARLQILDLNSCHNLETLPDEITLLKNLTHLDVSKSYLLESMPKGIEKLTMLQVLKGFVLGSSDKTPKISDLAKLEKLKRLSIHIGSEAVIQEGEFESLKYLSAVKCLKISWGVLSNTRYKDTKIILPSGLEKLEIEGFPSETTPEWLKPNMLPHGLKKLYIKGGKLTSIGHEKRSHMSKVEIVRLKYLHHLKNKIDPKYLQEMFPSLKYAQGKKVFDQSFEWSIEDGVST